MDHITLRKITPSDCIIISKAFADQGFNDKPVSLYERYVNLQEHKIRDIIIAESNGEFAGYLSINWISDYLYFKERSIPEIVDFNVLKKFQRKGIGTILMDEAEDRIKARSPIAGIGVGMYKDYGPAQILYIRRNYIPDGNGLILNSKPIQYGESITMNGDLVLFFTKVLKK